jgi:tetratricopeptide (TPR) repeat protein
MTYRILIVLLGLLGLLTGPARDTATFAWEPTGSTPPPTPEQLARLKERDELARRAGALLAEGKYQEALPPAAKALELTRLVHGPSHAEVADALDHVATLHELAGEWPEAVKRREEALALRERLHGPKHWRTADARLAVQSTRKAVGLTEAERVEVVAAWSQEREAGRLEQKGKLREAARAAQAALAVYRNRFGEDSAAVARALHLIARIRVAGGDVKGAREANERALAIRRRLLPGAHPDIARSLNNLGLCLSSLGERRRAEAVLAEAVEQWRQSLGDRDPLTAMGWSNLAAAQNVLGDHKAARRSYEEVLAIQRKTLPKGDPSIAHSLYNLGLVQQELQEYEGARKSYEEALAIFRKALPRDHPNIAATLNNLGNVLAELRQYEGARKSFAEALAIYRQSLPERHPAIATSLNNLGALQVKLQEYEGARKSFADALAIQRLTLPENHPEIAKSLNNLGVVQHHLRDHEGARQSHTAALAIFRQILPRDHPLLAHSLSGLAKVQLDLRDYQGARKSMEEALAIQRRALPENHPDLAHSLMGLGTVQGKVREYEGARKSFEEAQAIFRKALPRDHPDIAGSLNNLGLVQADLREYEAARTSYEAALAIFRKALPKDDPGIATCLLNLGIVQGDLRDYEGARKSHEEALAIFRKVLPRGHPDIATSLNNLGKVLRDLRDYEGARRSHEEALAIYRQALPRDHPDIAMGLINLGIVQVDLQDYQGARKSCEEALAIQRQALPRGHADLALSLNNLGAIQVVLREYAAARKSHEEALAIRRQALPKGHPLIALSLKNLGLLYVGSREDLQGALAQVVEAITIYQQDLSRLALAQAEAEQLRAAAQTRDALDLLLTLADPRDRRHANMAYTGLVAVKSAVTARQRWARRGRAAADPETSELLRQLRQANADLLSLASPAQAAAPDRRARDLAAEIRAATERRARLEQRLAAANPAYRRFLEQGRRDPAQVRAALPPGSALLDCIDYWHVSPGAKAWGGFSAERRMMAFVVRPDRDDVTVVPLGSTERLAQLVEQWRSSHGRAKRPPAGQPDSAAQLRKELWEPLEKHLDGVQVVLVSPDGPLNGLPLAALPGKEPGSFLLEQYAFAVVPVPQLLPDLLVDKTDNADSHAALAVGDIDFNAPLGGVPTEAPSRSFSPLPGTREEARAVHELFRKAFPSRPAELLTGAEATKAAFLAKAAGRSHLLVATHGFFLPEAKPKDDPATDARSLRSLLLEPGAALTEPALRSGLAFAGANRAALGKGDAFLTALEASEMDLDKVQLAVLSACETGLGQQAAGEGVLGLQRAFQLAGARTAVTGLWKVPDAATKELMVRFHRNLWEKRMGKLEALREAQLWLLREGKQRPELLRGGLEPPESPSKEGPVSPFFWAAFVLSGDWR